MSVCLFCLFGIDIITFLTDLGVFFALYLIVSLSLNLEAGFAGVPNFGKVMFVAAGAAISGSVCGRLAAIILGINTLGDFTGQTARIMPQVNAVLQNNIPLSFGLLLLGVLLALGIGAALGFLSSFPAIRLREDYLGMLLLGSAQLFQIFLGGTRDLVGGSAGIQVPDVFKWAEALGVRDLAVLGVVSGFAVLVYVYLERTARSPLGRTLRAVRDNEVASRALGKDDVAIRRNVIIVASAISAMAGALLTFYAGSVGSETWTRYEWTFWIWVMVIMGGAANNGGVALGSFSFLFLFKTLDIVKLHVQLPVDMNWIEYILFASILISVLIFRPGGILPERSSVTLPRKTVVAIMETKHGDDGPPKEQTAGTLQLATPAQKVETN
jgi:branched-chain amino acid transport system permease protein